MALVWLSVLNEVHAVLAATNMPYKADSGNVLVGAVANAADASINNANSFATIVKADQDVTGTTYITQSNGWGECHAVTLINGHVFACQRHRPWIAMH